MNDKEAKPPVISFIKYQLYLKKRFSKGTRHFYDKDWFWNPIGSDSHSIEEVKDYILEENNYKLWGIHPNAEYCIMRTISYKDSTEIIEEGKLK